MLFEAQGELVKAKKIYEGLKVKDETVPGPWKRLVSVNKAMNLYERATLELVKYLEIWMTDVEAWKELTNLYLAAEQHKHAAHCIEECILFEPYHYAHHVLYAEVQYTIGGIDGVELAKKHYQTALELKPNCARALYGLSLCTAALGSGTSKNKPKEGVGEHMTSLFELTMEKLEVAYAKSSDKGALMSKSLNQLREDTGLGK